MNNKKRLDGMPQIWLSKAQIKALEGNKGRFPHLEARLEEQASEWLKMAPQSVMDKKGAPESGDKHDYMSLAIYTWPDPDKPDGLPYIHKDGVVNPQIGEYDAPGFWNTCKAVHTLGLAYYYTEKPEYARHAEKLLDVWFLDEATKMNPHLNYGQFIPGECTGRCYGVIETTALIWCVNGIRLLEAKGTLPQAKGTRLRKWYADYLHWILTSEIGRQEAETTNNHAVWHAAQCAVFSEFTGDKSFLKNELSRRIKVIIDMQVAPDGSLPRELGRTRSFHYTSFALQAMVLCARVGAAVGEAVEIVEYKNVHGQGMEEALDWFVPYMKDTERKTWQWQEIDSTAPEVEVYPLLRQADEVFKGKGYEEVAKEISGEGYGDLTINLLGCPRGG